MQSTWLRNLERNLALGQDEEENFVTYPLRPSAISRSPSRRGQKSVGKPATAENNAESDAEAEQRERDEQKRKREEAEATWRAWKQEKDRLLREEAKAKATYGSDASTPSTETIDTEEKERLLKEWEARKIAAERQKRKELKQFKEREEEKLRLLQEERKKKLEEKAQKMTPHKQTLKKRMAASTKKHKMQKSLGAIMSSPLAKAAGRGVKIEGLEQYLAEKRAKVAEAGGVSCASSEKNDARQIAEHRNQNSRESAIETADRPQERTKALLLKSGRLEIDHVLDEIRKEDLAALRDCLEPPRGLVLLAFTLEQILCESRYEDVVGEEERLHEYWQHPPDWTAVRDVFKASLCRRLQACDKSRLNGRILAWLYVLLATGCLREIQKKNNRQLSAVTEESAGSQHAKKPRKSKGITAEGPRVGARDMGMLASGIKEDEAPKDAFFGAQVLCRWLEGLSKHYGFILPARKSKEERNKTQMKDSRERHKTLMNNSGPTPSRSSEENANERGNGDTVHSEDSGSGGALKGPSNAVPPLCFPEPQVEDFLPWRRRIAHVSILRHARVSVSEFAQAFLISQVYFPLQAAADARETRRKEEARAEQAQARNDREKMEKKGKEAKARAQRLKSSAHRQFRSIHATKLGQGASDGEGRGHGGVTTRQDGEHGASRQSRLRSREASATRHAKQQHKQQQPPKQQEHLQQQHQQLQNAVASTPPAEDSSAAPGPATKRSPPPARDSGVQKEHSKPRSRVRARPASTSHASDVPQKTQKANGTPDFAKTKRQAKTAEQSDLHSHGRPLNMGSPSIVVEISTGTGPGESARQERHSAPGIAGERAERKGGKTDSSRPQEIHSPVASLGSSRPPSSTSRSFASPSSPLGACESQHVGKRQTSSKVDITATVDLALHNSQSGEADSRGHNRPTTTADSMDIGIERSKNALEQQKSKKDVIRLPETTEGQTEVKDYNSCADAETTDASTKSDENTSKTGDLERKRHSQTKEDQNTVLTPCKMSQEEGRVDAGGCKTEGAPDGTGCSEEEEDVYDSYDDAFSGPDAQNQEQDGTEEETTESTANSFLEPSQEGSESVQKPRDAETTSTKEKVYSDHTTDHEESGDQGEKSEDEYGDDDDYDADFE